MGYYRDPDHEYFTTHFAELVKDHGGEWVVIVNGTLFDAGSKDALPEMLSRAKERFPDKTPLATPIPTEEDIECILSLFPIRFRKST